MLITWNKTARVWELFCDGKAMASNKRLGELIRQYPTAKVSCKQS